MCAVDTLCLGALRPKATGRQRRECGAISGFEVQQLPNDRDLGVCDLQRRISALASVLGLHTLTSHLKHRYLHLEASNSQRRKAFENLSHPTYLTPIKPPTSLAYTQSRL